MDQLGNIKKKLIQIFYSKNSPLIGLWGFLIYIAFMIFLFATAVFVNFLSSLGWLDFEKFDSITGEFFEAIWLSFHYVCLYALPIYSILISLFFLVTKKFQKNTAIIGAACNSLCIIWVYVLTNFNLD